MFETRRVDGVRCGGRDGLDTGFRCRSPNMKYMVRCVIVLSLGRLLPRARSKQKDCFHRDVLKKIKNAQAHCDQRRKDRE